MKIAIVTGIAGGIGKESALMLAEKGYTVVGMGRSECPDLSNFDGLDITYVSGDISSAEDRRRLFDAAIAKGEISILVNVAGVAPKERRDILEMTEESYDYVMGINTKGTLFLTQAVANQMVKQGKGGSIVNISSCSAYTSSTSRGEYCISKAGVSMITKLFADRLASEKITVNEICPGIIATGMTAAVKEKYDGMIADGLVPLGRWGEPKDIAKAVVALCDGTFGFMTGESLILDGGMHIRRL
jgi:NAD(P)-dependent dehydrogenase (short-subunit alcohol dehydrogenase family)